jgi:membrane protein DedA with SNARE-associated domain
VGLATSATFAPRKVLGAAIWEFVVALIGRLFGESEDSPRELSAQPREQRRRRIVLVLAFLVLSTLTLYVLLRLQR